MPKSRGLGDSIDKFTTATGIKAAVNKATGGGCGCNKRKDQLNNMFPYNNSAGTGKSAPKNRVVGGIQKNGIQQ